MNFWKFFAIAYFCSFYDGHLVQRLWCSVTNCSTNSRGKEKGSAFKLPQKDSLRSQGIGFVGQEYSVDKKIFIFENISRKKYLSRNEKRTRSKAQLNPVPTIVNSKKFSILKRKHPKTNDQSLKNENHKNL